MITGAIGVGGIITWYDPDTGLPFVPGKPRLGHLSRDEYGNTVLVAGAGNNDCHPGYTDASGGFHPAHRSHSGPVRGQY